MITVKQLRDHLATLPDDLPIVFSMHVHQHELRTDEMPKLAFWTGDSYGTPMTKEKIGTCEKIGIDPKKHIHPCVVIGWIE